MAWELDADKPIYAQLTERLQTRIILGQYRPGEKLPSVRELAAAAAVNPNTMQKALAELERKGIISTQSTNGKTVTQDLALIQDMTRKLARGHADAFFAGMGELGYTRAEALELLQEIEGAGRE